MSFTSQQQYSPVAVIRKLFTQGWMQSLADKMEREEVEFPLFDKMSSPNDDLVFTKYAIDHLTIRDVMGLSVHVVADMDTLAEAFDAMMAYMQTMMIAQLGIMLITTVCFAVTLVYYQRRRRHSSIYGQSPQSQHKAKYQGISKTSNSTDARSQPDCININESVNGDNYGPTSPTSTKRNSACYSAGESITTAARIAALIASQPATPRAIHGSDERASIDSCQSTASKSQRFQKRSINALKWLGPKPMPHYHAKAVVSRNHQHHKHPWGSRDRRFMLRRHRTLDSGSVGSGCSADGITYDRYSTSLGSGTNNHRSALNLITGRIQRQISQPVITLSPMCDEPNRSGETTTSPVSVLIS